MIRGLVIVGGLALLIAVGIAALGLPVLETCGALLTGWLHVLNRSLAALQFDAAGAATAGACLLVLFAGGHLFLRWLVPQVRGAAGEAEAKPWTARSTGLLLGVVVLMFVAGISFVGAAHQVAWLATAEEPRTTRRLQLYDGSDEAVAKDNLRETWMGVEAAIDSLRRAGNRRDENGRVLHSWQSQILFGLNIANLTDRDLPWDHPRNIVHFELFVPSYLSPAVAQLRTAEGLAVSHYSGNVHLFGEGDVTRGMIESSGAGNTILAGEAAANFKCWGDPGNLRDPAMGLHTSPDGYGGHYGEGTLFLFLDGSVRSVAADVDPTVLAAMSGKRQSPP